MRIQLVIFLVVAICSCLAYCQANSTTSEPTTPSSIIPKGLPKNLKLPFDPCNG